MTPAEIVEALADLDAGEVREVRKGCQELFGIALGFDEEPPADGAGVPLVPLNPLLGGHGVN